MNITLTGTKIKQDTKLLAFEKNNNVDVINITVDTDESWTYKLDVKYPACSCGDDKYNIIDLMRNGKQLSVILTSAMLPFAGRYQCQLRGISGNKVYHTDTFDVWVKRSIEPGEVYNPIPSEFYQIEKNITEMNNHPPYPSDDGYWMIWDIVTKQYVKSDIEAATGQGAVRYDIAQELTDEQQKQARENIGAIEDAGTMFIINITGKEWANNFTADKTFAEIDQALSNGLIPVCIMPKDVVARYGIGACYYSNKLTPPKGNECFYFVSVQSNKDYDKIAVVSISSNDTLTVKHYSRLMTGATDQSAGQTGMVPEPWSGDNTKFLRGDATWADVPVYELPVAANEQLGGVKPVAKTGAMTQDVGVDENGKLYTEPAKSGGTDLSLGITGAAAGQIAKITAVDENGVPTAWTPADMPSGGGDDGEMGELLLSAEASDVAAFSQSFDTKNYDKFLFFIGGTKASAAISINNGKFFTDGMWFTICYYTGWLDATNTSYPDGCIVQTLERVTDDFASVTYDKVPTALAPIRSTFQGTSSQFVSPKRGYLQGVTNETPDGIELQFSGTVSYVKIAVYGYH